MTHHTDAELLPCPFCGSEAHFEMDDDRWEWIECGSCGMQGNRSASLMEDCKPKLAEAWNRRAPAAPVPLRKPTVDQVSAEIGYHASAWDCVDPRELIDAILMLAAAPQPPEEQASVSNGTLASQPPFQTEAGAARQLEEIAVLVRVLVRALRKADPANPRAARALDYLKRHGLQGNPLRAPGD